MSEEIDVCSGNVIHKDKIKEVKSVIPKDEELYDLSEFFKVLGDLTRRKMICALFQTEMCVCDLAELLGVTQSAISHQLKTLKIARLVRYRREGKIVYYSLDDEHIKHIFDEGLKHIRE